MEVQEMCEIAEKVDYSYDSFTNDVNPKRSNRRDLHAFILLDELVPGNTSIVSCAEHDQIWLEVEPGELAKVITKEQINELVKCGVIFEDEALTMFR